MKINIPRSYDLICAIVISYDSEINYNLTEKLNWLLIYLVLILGYSKKLNKAEKMRKPITSMTHKKPAEIRN